MHIAQLLNEVAFMVQELDLVEYVCIIPVLDLTDLLASNFKFENPLIRCNAKEFGGVSIFQHNLKFFDIAIICVVTRGVSYKLDFVVLYLFHVSTVELARECPKRVFGSVLSVYHISLANKLIEARTLLRQWFELQKPQIIEIKYVLDIIFKVPSDELILLFVCRVIVFHLFLHGQARLLYHLLSFEIQRE